MPPNQALIASVALLSQVFSSHHPENPSRVVDREFPEDDNKLHNLDRCDLLNSSQPTQLSTHQGKGHHRYRNGQFYASMLISFSRPYFCLLNTRIPP